MATDTKYIVVTGGVISGVGKGVTTASIAKIIKMHGYSVTVIKIDPYINYDAGTLRPTEHGEVWVTDDGGEIDQDLGTYERFLNMSIPKKNNITTGQIYKSVIDKERRGEYLGETVQFVPHITDEIVHRITAASHGYDIAIIEVGGTCGDYENVPFLFALKGLERDLGSDHVLFMLVSYLPAPAHIDEMKTKPTQHAIKLLCEQGIMPDFIVCRAEKNIDIERVHKIEMVAHIPTDSIFLAPNVDSVYQVPLELEKQDCGKKLLKRLNLSSKMAPDWTTWQQKIAGMQTSSSRISVAVIGKYLETGNFQFTDSYLSVYHALHHAGAALAVGVDIHWIDAQQLETDPEAMRMLDDVDGILVPVGFGARGAEGKINAIQYARTHNIPYLGLCYGMQMAVVEFARHVAGMQGAHSVEVNPATPFPVVDILPWQKERIAHQDIGGTMRLGAYKTTLDHDSHAATLYDGTGRMTKDYVVEERHRHRFEVNPAYVDQLQQAGMRFSGFYYRQDGTRLAEYIELADHPFFIATQSHPEFTSRFDSPNPLFVGFVRACSG